MKSPTLPVCTALPRVRSTINWVYSEWSGTKTTWVLAMLFVSLAPANAGEETNSAAPPLKLPAPKLWTLAVRWENDTFGGTDRFYTDGASLSLIHTGGGWLDPLADRLPWGNGRRSVGYDFGQIMVTSGDKLMPVPDPRDRPYAGILYVGLSLHIDHDNIYHGFKLTTGVIGPWSIAEQTQKQVHRWVDSPLPQGWDYQLHNEPILNLTYEHRRKYRLLGGDRGFAVEGLPTGTLMLGNMLTQASMGGQMRFGYNIPDDFGKTLLRGMGHLPAPRSPEAPEREPGLGIYAYGGVHGTVVLRNVTLDGNSWKESPNVDKKLLVPAAEVGVALVTRRFTTAFSYIFLGREFDGQKGNTEFGAITMGYRF